MRLSIEREAGSTNDENMRIKYLIAEKSSPKIDNLPKPQLLNDLFTTSLGVYYRVHRKKAGKTSFQDILLLFCLSL